MARRIVDLSYLLHDGMTTYPVHWSPPFEIIQLGRLGIEGRESRKIVMGTHTGTHVDAPRHFIPGGASIDQLPLEPFMGPASVVDFTGARPLQEMQVADFERQLGDRRVERLVMRFDWSDHWGSLKYYAEHPYISDAAAAWLVERGVRLLGMDTAQADSPKNGRGAERDSPVHKILLGAGIIKLEYLTNLRELRASEIELIALPIKIRDADGAPVRCVAIVNE
jgi:kynurenine formamidase